LRFDLAGKIDISYKVLPALNQENGTGNSSLVSEHAYLFANERLMERWPLARMRAGRPRSIFVLMSSYI
jgi:hypothetical protein